MWSNFRTLRFRLATVFLAVFGVILTIVCLSVLVARERDLWEQFDDRLKDRAAIIVDEISIFGDIHPDQTAARAEAVRRNPFRFPGDYFQIRREDESVAERSRNLELHTLPLTDSGRTSKSTAAPVVETLGGDVARDLLDGSGQIRLLTLFHRDPDGHAFYLQMGVSAQPIADSVRRLRRVFLVTIPGGLLLAGIAAWYLARQALAPITRIAEVAEQLRADNLSLRFDPPTGKDEIATMVATVNRMLDRISAAFQSQERFIADAAHELKSPLTVLLGEAQVLMKQNRTLEEYARFVASVQDEVRALAQTVDSMLTLARAEAGIPMADVSEVSVNEVVANAAESCIPAAQQREVRLIPTLCLLRDAGTGPLVLGDESLLGSMVTNLLRNAVRYSPPDESVHISVRQAGDEVQISVRDHGPGIPQDCVDKVFDRFFRVPDRNASFHGAGLGLTIVRGVAELHGGAVEAANLADGGCEFVVHLPLAYGPLTVQH